jgi:hypothetical protein
MQFLEPAGGVGDQRFEQHSLRNFADSDAISLKAEFFGRAHGLAASVLESLAMSELGTENSIYPIRARASRLFKGCL